MKNLYRGKVMSQRANRPALITLDYMHKNFENYSYAHILSRKLQLPAYFVAEITITRFGGQVQLNNRTVGRLDVCRTNLYAGECAFAWF